MDTDLNRCLKEMKMEEKLYEYLKLTVDDEGDYIHSLKDDAPQDVKDYFEKWLNELRLK